jgi:hypothetical protein
VVADGALPAEAEPWAVSEEMREVGIAAPTEAQSFLAKMIVSVFFMLETGVSGRGLFVTYSSGQPRYRPSECSC